MIHGVLFDMDGVLLDSEEFITQAGILMFKEKGFEVRNPISNRLREWAKIASWAV